MSILLNDQAPDFTLQDQNDSPHSLSQYRGKWVVLYFYPKDGTPGCTVEACNFRDNLGRLTAKGVVVLGVSADSVKSHKKFVDKQSLNFPILADEAKMVCELYGVWGEKSFMGRKFMGIARTTFLINPEGVVVKIYENVKVTGHVDEIIQDLEVLV